MIITYKALEIAVKKINKTKPSLICFLTAVALAGSIFASPVASEEEPVYTIDSSIKKLFTEGRPLINLRYRFEHVDDDLVPGNDAEASTLRVALGWESGKVAGISFLAEMEHIAQLGPDNYREGGFDLVNAGVFPIVADPPGTELNQAYARYTGIENLDIRIGRQDLTYRKAPFHRFIGNILWRQNWQTYDAARLSYKFSDKLKVEYAYLDQVNRIFGDDAPGAASRFDCDCHLFNVQGKPFSFLNLEAYTYLLDIENAAANSVDTFGIRGNGAYPFNDTFKVIYTGEYAHQSDSDGNPVSYDADYFLGEGGIGVKVGQPWLKNLVFKFSHEVLEGNGTGSFITPLSTAHAFQGWADRFLTTPVDGIEDSYFTAVGTGVFGGKVIVSYHMMESDNMSYDYGDEWNVLFARKFKKHFTLATKFAIYDADRNATALARAGGVQNNDVTKVWFWAQFNY